MCNHPNTKSTPKNICLVCNHDEFDQSKDMPADCA